MFCSCSALCPKSPLTVPLPQPVLCIFRSWAYKQQRLWSNPESVWPIDNTFLSLCLIICPMVERMAPTLSGYCEGSIRYCIHVVWHRASSYSINKVVIALQSPTQKHPPLPTPFSSSQTWSLFFLTILLTVGAELAVYQNASYTCSAFPSIHQRWETPWS